MPDDNGARLALKLPWHEQIADNFHAVLIAEAYTIQPDVVIDSECLEMTIRNFRHCCFRFLHFILCSMCLIYVQHGRHDAKNKNM